MQTVCELCGEWFIARSHAAKYCSDVCRVKAKSELEKRKRRKKRAAAVRYTVEDVIAFSERYRREKGVRISYGNAVALMERIVSDCG